VYVGSSRLGNTKGYQATDLAHLIDMTGDLVHSTPVPHAIFQIEHLVPWPRPSRSRNMILANGGHHGLCL
jgi:hypothetical protein